MLVRIEKGDLSVTADTLGAETVSVVYKGKERLWQNENGTWTGHAPVLFPVCGHTAVIINGNDYEIASHGFARRQEFALVERGADFMTFELTENDATRAVFPFRFRLHVTHRIVGDCLETEYEVFNPDTKPLCFSCGGHPSFALDDEISCYRIAFEKEETLVHRPHDGGGFLTGERVCFGKVKELPLSEEWLGGARTLIFSDISSREITLLKGEKRVASISFDGFSHLLLWHPRGSEMICIEPWHNLPDGEGACGEFTERADIVKLSSGQQKRFLQRIKYGYD